MKLTVWTLFSLTSLFASAQNVELVISDCGKQELIQLKKISKQLMEMMHALLPVG